MNSTDSRFTPLQMGFYSEHIVSFMDYNDVKVFYNRKIQSRSSWYYSNSSCFQGKIIREQAILFRKTQPTKTMAPFWYTTNSSMPSTVMFQHKNWSSGNSLMVQLGPVVRCFHCQGVGSIPGQGTKIPEDLRCGQKKKKELEFLNACPKTLRDPGLIRTN